MKKELFHIHTFRCKHAGSDPDCTYIERAIDLGAVKITFTDHAPFPGNPFGNRMDISELSEYIDTLNRLKAKYKSHIDVIVGLEIEFIPMFHDYYQELHNTPGLNLLMIGQHFYQHADGHYSFSDPPEYRKIAEAPGTVSAVIQGIRTGFLSVVAHPDRCFRYIDNWGHNECDLADQLIQVAIHNQVALEQNENSKRKTGLYRPEFWSRMKSTDETHSVRIINGLDAHSVKEMELLSI